MYIVEMMDTFATSFPLLFVTLAECLVISYIYGKYDVISYIYGQCDVISYIYGQYDVISYIYGNYDVISYMYIYSHSNVINNVCRVMYSAVHQRFLSADRVLSVSYTSTSHVSVH